MTIGPLAPPAAIKGNVLFAVIPREMNSVK
jgi:hypothetical protein